MEWLSLGTNQDHRRSSLNISPESFPFVKNLQRKSSQEINLAQNPPKSPLKIPSENLPSQSPLMGGLLGNIKDGETFTGGKLWQADHWVIRILNSKQCFPANRSAGKWKVCWRHQIALYIEENRSANDFWSDDGDHWSNDQSQCLISCFPRRPINCFNRIIWDLALHLGLVGQLWIATSEKNNFN